MFHESDTRTAIKKHIEQIDAELGRVYNEEVRATLFRAKSEALKALADLINK